ncbi:hypothetical protein [Borrelia parkeri]|uniref:hypothetical protein n=1 Tax=Borrelia parkeri TaxID=141 RepID=UPI0003DEE5EE|nr:hypothetical protein [Borrelia parkeri]AHF45632.1 hypothetical protein X966_p0425 [Borrelia parkeri HR1]UPA11285.1 hypothetical protein bpSLO_001136 [Borrelia parkeri]
MLLNIIFILTFLIFGCSSSSSETVEVLHNVSEGTLHTKMILKNDSGFVYMDYPNRSKKDNNKYFVLDFNIKTNKALNLLKVSFNGIELDLKEVLLSYDDRLKIDGEQYVLPFDDSIELTGCWIYLNPGLMERLKLLEFAKTEGLKLDVECIERKSGVKNNFSFNSSVSSAQKFFDLVDKFEPL